ncbi:hypothetical protein [Virgibacillus proomii]|uniref:hypothetical protein n=1 Tax=Virgibacillus proomii TaxID=84407 RepID=UPI001C0FBAAD|nr:hypothetical protein [Virgibacillus proomii]MBU5267263.1 hypothetical protein [Virgibacillus proomii]
MYLYKKTFTKNATSNLGSTRRVSIDVATGQGKLRSDASHEEKAFFFFKDKESFLNKHRTKKKCTAFSRTRKAT